MLNLTNLKKLQVRLCHFLIGFTLGLKLGHYCVQILTLFQIPPVLVPCGFLRRPNTHHSGNTWFNPNGSHFISSVPFQFDDTFILKMLLGETSTSLMSPWRTAHR